MGGLGDQTKETTGKTKKYTLEMAVAEERSRRFKKELRDQAKAAVDAERGIDALVDEVDDTGRAFRNASNDIDRFSGRLGLLVRGAAALGPSLIPIGAVAVPAVTGLASQLGFAALGAGTLITAFSGVGDALTAVNDAALDPTVENLDAAAEAMARVGPEAQQFVARFQELRPVLGDIRDAAAEGWFPGLTEALDDIEAVAPQIESTFYAIGEVGGNLAADMGDALSGPEWGEFLDFVERNAPQALEELGRSVGNVVTAMAQLWMAFDPLNDDFSRWLLDATQALEDWSTGLSETEGFQNFVDYIRDNGPQVADTFSAIGDALVQLTQAAAPLGGPVLRAVEGLANALAAIADSPIGTPLMAIVTAVSAVKLALSGFDALAGRASRSLATIGTEGPKAATGLQRVARTAVGLGAVAFALNSIAEALPQEGEIDSSDLARDLEAFSDGRASDAIDNLVTSLGKLDTQGDNLAEGARNVFTLWGTVGTATWEKAAQEIDKVDQALATMVETGDRAAAEELFAQIVAEAEAAGIEASVVRGEFDSFATAIDNAADSEDEFAGATQRSVLAQERQAAALKASRDAARETAEQFSGLGDSLNDSEVSLGGWLRELEKQAAALRNFRVNAQEAANKGLRQGLIEALQEAGPEGAMRMRQLANASESQIGRANKAWNAGQRQVREYTDEVGGVPKEAATDVLLNGVGLTKRQIADLMARLRAYGLSKPRATALLQDLASGDIDTVQGLVDKYGLTKARAQALLRDYASLKIGSIRGKLLGLDGMTATTYVDTWHRNYEQDVIMPAKRIMTQRRADGGTVNGPRQPYGDKVLTMLAPGEEVISNRFGQADAFRRDRDSGRIPAYADGGTVERPAWGMAAGGTVERMERPVLMPTSSGPSSVSVGLSDRDIDRLAAAMAQQGRDINLSVPAGANVNDFISALDLYVTQEANRG